MSLTTEQEDAEVTREEHGALKWAAFASSLVIAWLVMPVGVGILLGMLLAFVLQPLYGRLKPRLGRVWAALAVVVGTMLALAGAAAALGWFLVVKGVSLASKLIAYLSPGGEAGDVFGWVGGKTARFGITPAELTRRARSLVEDAAARIASEANTFVGALASLFLAALFAMLTLHVMLRHWETVSLRAQETFPLRPDYTRSLFLEFRRVGRTTLMGTLATGLVQGALATFGYWITGVPEPVFFGVATAVASLVPAVGTMLVWIPAGVALILMGHPGRGLFELAWGGLLVVAFSDYVIRPRLVGGESEVPSVVTFAALFGGEEVFGLKGLLIGPVLMALSVAVLRLYASETRLRRHVAPGPARGASQA